MRIWWPRLTRDSDPYEHRLYSGASLRDWRGSGTPIETLFRVVSIASATNAAPSAYAELRRAARRAALAGASDSEELVSIAEQTLVENDKLVEQLKAADERAELAALEREEAVRQLEELREEKRLAEKQMALAMAHSTAGSETSEFEAVSASPPQTVLEAVQQAEPQCPHLSFADRAFDSAADCPYEFPDDILEDLLKLRTAGGALGSARRHRRDGPRDQGNRARAALEGRCVRYDHRRQPGPAVRVHVARREAQGRPPHPP
jgi:hypothetical protein